MSVKTMPWTLMSLAAPFNETVRELLEIGLAEVSEGLPVVKIDEKPTKGMTLTDAVNEVKAMAKEGMHHPSMKPVLVGAGVGAVAGAVLPIVTVPIGLVVGAGFMLYKRIRP